MKELTLLLVPFSRLVDLGDPFSILSMVTAFVLATVILRRSMTGSFQIRAAAVFDRVF